MARRSRPLAFRSMVLALLAVVLAACGPSFRGTIHNPCTTEVTITWQPYRADGVTGIPTLRVAPAQGAVTFGEGGVRAAWVELSAPVLGWQETWTGPVAGDERDFWIDPSTCP